LGFDYRFDINDDIGFEYTCDYSENDYRLNLFDTIITVLTDGKITSCKEEGVSIEYYVSPDKGYILLYANYDDPNEENATGRYEGQPIICFTGLVNYSKTSVNENQSFRKKNSFERRFRFW
jgi:hypothetical protein